MMPWGSKMTDEEMTYRTLRKIQQMETNSPTLSKIKPDFYKSLSEYLQELSQRYEKESSSQKKTLLKEEIENIKKISLSIYELREKKILLAAISKARGGNPVTNNLIDFENTLYKSVLKAMDNSRNTVFKKESETKVIDNKPTDSGKVKDIKEEKNEKVQQQNPIVKVNKFRHVLINFNYRILLLNFFIFFFFYIFNFTRVCRFIVNHFGF
jgi:DNA replication initiation complex subunit (GINS family)